MSEMFVGPDGKPRCRWCGAAPEFLHYHDAEWGFPVADDHRLFEKLSLEGFQSGLSWRTILAKRENFRAAFCDFDFAKVARFGKRDVNRLVEDKGIIRHRGKIEAVINNARQALELVEREGSLAAFIWRYEPDPKQLPAPQTVSTSPEATRLSKDLKRLGWKFVGPTTVYAFMQAMGLINDHVEGCVIRAKVARPQEVQATDELVPQVRGPFRVSITTPRRAGRAARPTTRAGTAEPLRWTWSFQLGHLTRPRAFVS